MYVTFTTFTKGKTNLEAKEYKVFIYSGNNWGVCPDGVGRVGCGPQVKLNKINKN